MYTHRRQLLAIASVLALASLTQTACAATTAAKGGGALVQSPEKSSGSGITVRYRLDGTPAAGRPTRVVLVLAGVTDADQASVRLAADPDLELQGDSGPARLAPGGPTTIELTVTPRSDGLRYLNIFTTQHGITSATAVPIQAGEAAPARPSGKLQGDPKGDKLITLPVK